MIFNEDGTTEFVINMLGEINRQTYIGKFKVKCALSPLDHINADKLYRELLGINPVAASQKAINNSFALSQLKYRIIEWPAFWEDRTLNGSHVVDTNVIFEVLNRAIEAEEKYLKYRAEEAERQEEELTEALTEGDIEKEEEVEQQQL